MITLQTDHQTVVHWLSRLPALGTLFFFSLPPSLGAEPEGDWTIIALSYLFLSLIILIIIIVVIIIICTIYFNDFSILP